METVLDRRNAKEVFEILKIDSNISIKEIINKVEGLKYYNQTNILVKAIKDSGLLNNISNKEILKVSNKEMLKRFNLVKSTSKYERTLKEQGWEKVKDSSSFPSIVYYVKEV